MTPLFKKLNLKDQREIVVLNAPASFEAELARLEGLTVRRTVKGLKGVEFAIAFVTKQSELDAAVRSIARLAQGDAVVWFAYPKGSSKRCKSEINRDNGWKVVGQEGFEPVRMVAIDEDWSGLRVRRVEFIKTMKRDARHAMTSEGKRKAGKQ
jgi:hypothetical protein